MQTQLQMQKQIQTQMKIQTQRKIQTQIQYRYKQISCTLIKKKTLKLGLLCIADIPIFTHLQAGKVYSLLYLSSIHQTQKASYRHQ